MFWRLARTREKKRLIAAHAAATNASRAPTHPPTLAVPSRETLAPHSPFPASPRFSAAAHVASSSVSACPRRLASRATGREPPPASPERNLLRFHPLGNRDARLLEPSTAVDRRFRSPRRSAAVRAGDGASTQIRHGRSPFFLLPQASSPLSPERVEGIGDPPGTGLVSRSPRFSG